MKAKIAATPFLIDEQILSQSAPSLYSFFTRSKFFFSEASKNVSDESAKLFARFNEIIVGF
jgi:hypothetical protein